MENRTGRAALVPKELLDAWRVIQSRPGFSTVEVKKKECDYECNVDGFMSVQFDGRPVDPYYDGMTYAQTCPIHRRRGVTPIEHAAPWTKVGGLTGIKDDKTGEPVKPWPRLEVRPTKWKPMEAVGKGTTKLVKGFKSAVDVAKKIMKVEPERGEL